MSTTRDDTIGTDNAKSTKEVTPRQPRSLWLNRDFMLLWSGQMVSNVGTQVSTLAFPLLILALTGVLIQNVGVIQTILIDSVGLALLALAAALNGHVRNARPLAEIENEQA